MSCAMHYGILSTFPPTRCGIATFSAALQSSLSKQGHCVEMVRIRDDDESISASIASVTAELIATDARSQSRVANALNLQDLAFIQHEFGLYGGADGSDILEVANMIHVPKIAILHTVLPRPSVHQRDVMNELIANVEGVVVMTDAARRTLGQVFQIDESKVNVIPHGASIKRPIVRPVAKIRPIILTWGLLGPGKGIEWVIDAMSMLKYLSPQPLYIVAGQTHPKVLANEGDAYRRFLEQRVLDKGVQDLVVFDNSYRDLSSLGRLIASAAVVVLPYDSPDQATSGVLVDAVAAGRPVIATEFPHAQELLHPNVGMTVPHQDAFRLFKAIRQVLCEPSVARSMTAAANRLAPQLSWDAVANQYHEFATQLLVPSTIGAA